jgi:V/A-type H+-transporting ATPase subunit I
MLIGDAAYGLIYFILTWLAQRKLGRKLRDKRFFVLFYILSSCAIIWGILSGTFFGQEWLPAFVKPLIPALRNNKNVIALCFLIGALHLSIAHLWRAVIRLPSRVALSEFGWVSILWGAFFLAKTLVLGDAFPEFGRWFLIAGTILVVFFTSPAKNLLKGIGLGLGRLLLNLMSSFADLVSYIRLFAIGLATVAIADAFNKMALGVGYNGILSGLLTSLILLVGHALNIILGPMSLLVHGVRLNILEFCNHADIKWSGFAYKPLREDEQTN